MLRFGEFKVERASFEIRYPFSFALWDRAGQLWERIARTRPKLRVVQASPTQVVATTENQEISVEMEKAFVIGHVPDSDLESFGIESTDIAEAVVSTLGISSFSRVGLRLQFVHDSRNRRQAAADLLSFGLHRLPAGGHFGVKDSELVGGQYVVNWEGPATGARLEIRTEERRIEFRPAPSAYDVEPIERATYRVVVDFDFHTVAAMTPGQLQAKRWIQGALHVARRDIPKYIGE